MIRQKLARGRRSIGSLLKRSSLWWISVVAITLVAGAGLSWRYWEILHSSEDSFSTTISNLSFVLGGIVAIELALWRSFVGERQTAVSQKQAETAQKEMLNQQLQKGAEMLGSSTLSVRLGGIYALRHLATDHPELFHVQVMEQLSAFIRGATRADGQPTASVEETVVSREKLLSLFPDHEDTLTEFTIKKFVARSDIQEAMNAIAFCHDRNLEIEAEKDYWLNFRGADLRGVDLSLKNLSRAPLRWRVSTTVYQQFATGRYTDMRGAKMDDVSLFLTKLSGVDLSRATGLTQDKVNDARFDSDSPPELKDTVDAKTGETIVWKGSFSQDEK